MQDDQWERLRGWERVGKSALMGSGGNGPL